MSSSNSRDDARWRDQLIGNAQAPLAEPWFIRDVRDKIPEAPPRPVMRDIDYDERFAQPLPYDVDPGLGGRRGGTAGGPPPPMRTGPRPWVYLAVAALVAIVALALWLTAAPKVGGAPPTVAEAEPVLPTNVAAPPVIPQAPVDCASPETIARLRNVLIGLARQGGGNLDNGLDRRAASLSVSVAAAPDGSTGDGRGVACRGSATYQPFGDAAATSATLAYRVRPAAGGTVAISMLEGVAPIVAALTRNDPVVAEPDETAEPSQEEATELADAAIPEFTAARPASARLSPPLRTSQPMPTSLPSMRMPPPSVRMPPQSMPVPQPRIVEAPRLQRDVRLSNPGFASPSFDCRGVTSQVLRMVCANDDLAALDRDMSDLFFTVHESADRDTRAELEAGRRDFIARRQRCGDEACVEREYEDRIADLEVYR